ncbi:MAG: helix-turn-helix transcriptional regulator [Clostridia bacterium]|nr:helix-turn-helix transcriptional regulator [Clostridia bacterium]
MRQKTIKGTTKLGESIKSRRQELGLTIEEAATKAGVGTKSWCRYESGESIRNDKAKGICKALNWNTFPDESDTDEFKFDFEKYKKHKAWSQYLCDEFGEAAAISFAIGSDIVLEHIEEDLRELSTMPIGSHLGQIPISMMRDSLPEQFLMRYNYDFLYQLRSTVINIRAIARSGNYFLAHSVLQELVIYMFMQESVFLMDCMFVDMENYGVSGLDMVEDWAFEIFDDMDIVTNLYSNMYLTEENIYHFNHWAASQFHMDNA